MEAYLPDAFMVAAQWAQNSHYLDEKLGRALSVAGLNSATC
jgi:hypothetical protein